MNQEVESILVRQLEARDLDAIVRIDARYSRKPRREYYQRKLEEALRDTAVRISLAAETDGIVSGFILARVYYGEFGLPEPFATIDSIGVDPGFERRGIGAALVAQLETNLRALGVERLRTQVEWDALPLLGFLRRGGFAPAPVLTLEKRVSG